MPNLNKVHIIGNITHDPEVGTVWEMNGKTYLVTMSVYYPEISEWYVRMSERKRDKRGGARGAVFTVSGAAACSPY
jgi:hypothetical protein